MINEISMEQYTENDINEMINIWNEVVEEGNSFPQTDKLTIEEGKKFFSSQSYCGIAKDSSGNVIGLYILHPNNVGRCSHIANASYAVSSEKRGLHIGEKLVLDCIEKAKQIGFKLLQFNAVVESNIHARHLYERLGFVMVGKIPKGFKTKNETYENIFIYYKKLK